MRKLLSYKYKIIGTCLVGCASVLSVIYFVYGLQRSVPVFAVFTDYTETEIFTSIKTDIAEEVILLLFIAGFFMLTFSKEKDEKHCLRAVRIKAAGQTIFVYILWLAFSVIFAFGSGFSFIFVLNIIFPFVVYLILFYSKKNKVLKKRRLRRLQHRILKPATDLKEQ